MDDSLETQIQLNEKGTHMGFLNLSDPRPKVSRVVDYDSPSPTLTLEQKIERDLKESPPRGWSRTYLFLLAALIPLMVSLVHPGNRYDVQARLAHTHSKLPAKDQVRIADDFAKNKQPIEKLLMTLPGHRIENAFLGRDSWMHWVYAAVAAGAFLGFMVLVFPSSRAKPRDLLRIGLFT